MSEIWLTSDIHFNHKNIIQYCNRPFEDVSEMTEKIVNSWNEVISWDDFVVIVGDLAMGIVQDSLDNIVPRLNGFKFLVPGNHDDCWLGSKKFAKLDKEGRTSLERYEAAGLTVATSGYLKLCFPNMPQLHVSHFPYKGKENANDYEERYPEWRLEDDGNWLICGHVHDAWRQNDKQINVGLDAWGGGFVNLRDIIDIIRAGPNYLDSIPWPGAKAKVVEPSETTADEMILEISDILEDDDNNMILEINEIQPSVIDLTKSM